MLKNRVSLFCVTLWMLFAAEEKLNRKVVRGDMVQWWVRGLGRGLTSV